MFQLFLNNQYGSLTGKQTPGADIFFVIVLSLLAILALGILLYLISILTRNIFKIAGAFDRVVLQIQVPKERKSEGTGQSTQQEDRLEHIKEEIGITETLFATVAGLRAERGIRSWFSGRSDHLSFELVVQNSLIYFYVAVPHKLRNFIEQQIHAQYTYAHIEEMSDYNIFGQQSNILGAYLNAKKAPVFPFKTYKTMDSDPLSSLLNALSRIREENSSAAVQFVIRSAKRAWRRQGVYIVREVKKGEKFERVAHRNRFMRAMGKSSKALGEVLATSSNKNQQSMNNRYQLSSMEEEMLKGIEQKLSKGGLDMTLRVISTSDNEGTARLNLENIINSFSQFNLYRYGNEFGAIMPRNQKKIIQEFIYRSFR